MKNYSQNSYTYTENLNTKLEKQDEYTKDYLEKFFLPWELKKLSYSKKEASWGEYYINKKIYLENHKIASKDWLTQQKTNSNFEKYNTNLQKAITNKKYQSKSISYKK